MNICHISFSFTIGGIENLVVDILNRQSKKATVSLVVVNNAYNVEILQRISDRVKIVLVNRPPGDKYNFGYLLKLWISLKKIHPDVIHCHTHNLIKILFPFRKKCVYTAHELGVPLKYLTKYRRLYSISAAVKRDLMVRGSLDSDIVYNGVDGERFVKRVSYSYAAEDTFRIVQVSRLQHEKKGQDVLVRAMDILVNKKGEKSYKAYIIGDGPSEAYLKRLICEYRLESWVVLLGSRDRSWIYDNLNSFHLLAQPSRFEGFGLTLLESLFAGLPVVSSNIGGPAEILQNIPSALLFENEDANDLANKIQAAKGLYEKGEILNLNRLAVQHINNRYSVDATADNYLTKYSDVNSN